MIAMHKICRCPHYGKQENIDRLAYAKNHVFYCRSCGEIIKIDEGIWQSTFCAGNTRKRNGC